LQLAKDLDAPLLLAEDRENALTYEDAPSFSADAQRGLRRTR